MSDGRIIAKMTSERCSVDALRAQPLLESIGLTGPQIAEATTISLGKVLDAVRDNVCAKYTDNPAGVPRGELGRAKAKAREVLEPALKRAFITSRRVKRGKGQKDA